MTQAKAEMPQHSLIVTMANKYGLERGKFLDTLAGTIFPSGNSAPSQAQIAAFLVVANNYSLNPFIKEIYAFPGKGGGIVPIVSVDGWLTIINRQPQLDGIEFVDHIDKEGKLSAVTAKIYRKDRSHATEVTEYMSECYRNTDPWNKYGSRMLRHKALIQGARYAFGLAGIYDPDEAERIVEAGGTLETAIAEKTQERAKDLRERLTVVAKTEVAADDDVVADVGLVETDFVDAEVIAPEPEDTDAAAEASAIEAEPIDEDESKLADLRIAVKEALVEKVGGMKSDQKSFLRGRIVDNEPAAALQEMLSELEAM